MQTFEIPKVILSRYDELYDLVTNKSVDGEIAAIDLAKYLGKSVAWVLPLYQFETQNKMLISNIRNI